MKGSVHIVVACANRKTVPVTGPLRLRSLRDVPDPSRLDAWTERLHNARADRVSALDLYAGDYWAVVRDLPEAAEASGASVSLWVASAGYGLLRADDAVCGYSATFARGQPDSVPRPQAAPADVAATTRTWWKGLAARPHGRTDARKSLRAVLAEDPGGSLLFLGSPAYVDATCDDLASARAELSDPDRLVVLTSRTTGLPEGLEGAVVRSHVRLQAVVGGARTSLHARVARKVLRELAKYPLRASVLHERLERLARRTRRHAPVVRRPLSDDEVVAFIGSQLSTDRDASFTALLRKLRGFACACEYSRFKRLFRAVEKKHAA